MGKIWRLVLNWARGAKNVKSSETTESNPMPVHHCHLPE